jgi:hypothetical protein
MRLEPPSAGLSNCLKLPVQAGKSGNCCKNAAKLGFCARFYQENAWPRRESWQQAGALENHSAGMIALLQ